MIDYTSFRTRLEAEQVRIVSDLTSIARYDEQSGDWEALPDPVELKETDENNEADAIEEWNERRAVVATLEVTFNNIKRALEKIDAGTYGICEICKAYIEAERLEFLPEARTCTTHMDEEELLSL